MKTKHLPYHLGILIPCFLIALNGITTYYTTVRFASDSEQKFFAIAYASVCITYLLAIVTSPGYTDGYRDPDGKYIECLKCKLPKPERAHHCKTCGRCVLRMDHHCPWTENCVGFRNLPHFMRFLSSAVLLNVYGVFKSAAFLIYAFEHRRYLAYFIPYKSRIWICLVALIGDLFVALTLAVLWIRVVIDTLNGRTQIEVWEYERAETLAKHKLASSVEFPFDVDVFTNAQYAFGFVWDWLLPWSTPPGNGHTFPRMVDTDPRWPPEENKRVIEHEFYRADRWTSFEGEAITDFGVDLVDVEHQTTPDTSGESKRDSSGLEDVPLAELRFRHKQ